MPSEQDIFDAHAHKLWPLFVEWTEEDEDLGIDPHQWPDDWWPWWECFVAGAIAEMRLKSE